MAHFAPTKAYGLEATGLAPIVLSPALGRKLHAEKRKQTWTYTTNGWWEREEKPDL